MSRTPRCELCQWRSTCTFLSQGKSKPAVIKQLDFRKRSTVYSMDLPAEGVFVIQKGSVALTSVDQLGNPRITQFLGPSELMGIDALLCKRTRVFTAQCREDSILCFAPIDAFEQFLRANIICIWDLLLKLDEQAHETAVEKLQLSGQCVRRRINFAIDRLAAKRARGEMQAYNVAVRQWEIAQFVGTSCETVSREFALQRSRKCKLNDKTRIS